MPSPIGHAMAGYLVYRAGSAYKRPDHRPVLVLCLFMAVIADLDFLPGILYGHPLLYHEGISHSLGFAVGGGLLAATLYGIKTSGMFMANWSLFFLAYATHPIMDLFQPHKRPPFGIPFLWPGNEGAYISPFPIFWGFHHAAGPSDSTGEWISGMIDFYNVGAIGIEILVVLPMILAVRWLQGNNI
jgi:membrane-bound metal-dependent hydrolase YbcI (DUF457 family)